MVSVQSIPILNLQHFHAQATRSAFVQQLGEALEQVGFFALVNHGIDQALIQQAYEVAQQFFQLPEPVKLQYEDQRTKGQRGFTRFGREHAKGQSAPDLKEFWHVGRELSPHPLHDRPLRDRLPNVSIAEVPQFKPVMQHLYTQLEQCAIQLLQACALYLGEPEFLLSDMVQDSDSILRIIHYPPVPTDADPASLRSAAHEDINLITLLCEATADGLELQQRDGSWLPIQAQPGQIIVDSGDMLQQLTNGQLRSTTHRVINPNNSRDRRFSMPFFVHPQSSVDLKPLASCVDRAGEQRFPAVTAGAYLQQRLEEIGLV